MKPAAPAPPRAPRWQWVAAAALILAAAAIPVLRFLVFWPKDQWQVDVEVYRQAGESILIGRPVYAALTEAPQLLPFTYPPFAAVLAIPLALLPFGLVGWLWTAAQIAATTGIVWYAGYRLIHAGGRVRPLVLGLLAAPMFWLHPVGDGIRFGQVNAFIVLACLTDLRRPRPRVLAGVAPGVLVGLAMAVKLTPGVFVVHYLLNRRWREAGTAIGTAALAWGGAFLLLPEASLVFWGGALQDPARLGPNMGTSNQSIRGVLMRIGPDGVAEVALWLALAAVVAAYGFALARRAWRAGDTVTEVATVGLLACLLSPVAWIHHFHWMVVVILAVLGGGVAATRSGGSAGGVDPDSASDRASDGARGSAVPPASGGLVPPASGGLVPPASGGAVPPAGGGAVPATHGRADGTAARVGLGGIRLDRARVLAALALTIWWTCRLPWWGITWIANGWPPILAGRLLQNADLIGALLALALLAWALDRDRPVDPRLSSSPGLVLFSRTNRRGK